MNFDLTEERQMLQDTLRRFLAEAQGDVWSGLAELGVIAALFSEEQGGFGGAGFDLALVFEELGRADLSLPLIDAVLVPGRLLAGLGEDVSGLMDGTERLALAHTEANGRYDLEWVETRADGDRLSGEKSAVIAASTADRLIVSARHSGAPDDTAGIGLWLVDPDAPGLTRRSYALAQGGEAADISLSDTPGTRLTEEGFDALADTMAAGLLAQTAETLGAMETALTMTQDYLGTRKQFGRPIGSFQALSHRMVDLMVAQEQARSAVILAAAHLDHPAEERDRVLSAAKNILGRTGQLVAEETIQLHGGIGMTDEYALSRFAKRIVMADHRFGDTDHHMERFIALGL
ncbi:acyl-CoA dehydrogenase [uncultured Roseobacter sp.]|uniref:acyl-CoA dehydrogenase family protein n=1 Tax=uncultured Roseobacter sp. TaxID=114847 RepID=UPI00262BDDF0|nr:acyl-CoA dehydrogenase [uncultured Roseobacter sp.]